MVNSTPANYFGYTVPASDGHKLKLAGMIKVFGNKSEWCTVFIDSCNAVSNGISVSRETRALIVLLTLSFSIFR